MDTNTKIVEELHRALRRSPFEPFWIVMNDGSKHLIHRDFQAGTDGRHILYLPERGASVRLNVREVRGLFSASPQLGNA